MRSMFDKGVQKLLYAEGVNGAAEENRGLMTCKICSFIEGMGGPLEQLYVMAQFVYLAPQKLIQATVIQAVDSQYFSGAVIRLGVKEDKFFCI